MVFEIKWRYDPRTCWTILSNCLMNLKNFQVTQRDSNPWPLGCRCSALTNWAMKSHSWEQVNLLGSCFPVKGMSSERSVIWSAVFEIKWRYDPRTCWTILSNCLMNLKNFQVTQRDSNPWPLRCQCSALTNWATKSHSWEQVNLLGSCFPMKGMSSERSVIWSALFEIKWRYDPRTCWTILSNCLMNLKNFQVTQRDSNPWPLRCRCSHETIA